MVVLKTEVLASGLTGKAVTDFMIGCTDEEYRKWWRGVHIAFHTIRRFPGNLGNIVCFDEYVGTRRLRFRGVVIKYVPGKEIVWQMKKGFRLPAWLALYIRDEAEGAIITHVLSAGFRGAGRIFDALLRTVLSAEFEKQLGEHAKVEFSKLHEVLLP